MKVKGQVTSILTTLAKIGKLLKSILSHTVGRRGFRLTGSPTLLECLNRLLQFWPWPLVPWPLNKNRFVEISSARKSLKIYLKCSPETVLVSNW